MQEVNAPQNLNSSPALIIFVALLGIREEAIVWTGVGDLGVAIGVSNGTRSRISLLAPGVSLACGRSQHWNRKETVITTRLYSSLKYFIL